MHATWIFIAADQILLCKWQNWNPRKLPSLRYKWYHLPYLQRHSQPAFGIKCVFYSLSWHTHLLLLIMNALGWHQISNNSSCSWQNKTLLHCIFLWWMYLPNKLKQALHQHHLQQQAVRKWVRYIDGLAKDNGWRRVCLNVDLLLPSYFPTNTLLIDSGPLVAATGEAFSIKCFTWSFSNQGWKIWLC